MVAEDSLGVVAEDSLGVEAEDSLGVVAEDSLCGVAACSLDEEVVVTRKGQKLGAWVWWQRIVWVG